MELALSAHYSMLLMKKSKDVSFQNAQMDGRSHKKENAKNVLHTPEV